ncbi:hypothetical protein LCGC14_2183240 [marine sediment metagenome]|uniref:Uncharacterized protein n=1 Tax=marine sediment metagenome TaxID=412755 RepID=A0A0F9FZ36_9ZZZZ
MAIGTIRRIGRPLSHIQTGLLKKPIRRANEGTMAWYKRYKRWMTATEAHDKWKESQRAKTQKKGKPRKKVKPKKKLTERERRIKQRKDAEKLLGIKRGVKKKKTPPKKKKKK